MDPTGLSRADWWKIFDRFNQTVERLTKSGKRMDNGYANNLVRGLHTITGGLFGQKYMGCVEQAWAVLSAEADSGQHYDDKWTFELSGTDELRLSADNPGPHHWVTA